MSTLEIERLKLRGNDLIRVNQLGRGGAPEFRFLCPLKQKGFEPRLICPESTVMLPSLPKIDLKRMGRTR